VPLPPSPAPSLQFLAYERCKAAYDGLVLPGWRRLAAGVGGASTSATATPPLPPPLALSPGEAQARSLACGALAGVVGKLAVYPLDTVKRRLQVQGMARSHAYGAPAHYAGTLDALVTIAREEGVVGGWYKGTTPALLKSAVSVAVTFWAYEGTLALLIDSGGDASNAAARARAGCLC
jgi:hypothetical protein